MSKKFQIQLPKPCNEDWDRMNDAGQGRFCNSCRKVVVDFTGMSDAQLVAFFKKPSTGSICGRFDNDQLERDLSIPGKRLPWLKYILQLLVPTFLFACKAKSQGEPKLNGDTIFVESKKSFKDRDGNLREQRISLRKIKGKVTDENGIGIPGASVVIKGHYRGVLTDGQGDYEIDLTGYDPKQIIVFSWVGFMDAERSVGYLQRKSNCVLKLQPMIMGEVVVTNRYYREKKKNKASN